MTSVMADKECSGQAVAGPETPGPGTARALARLGSSTASRGLSTAGPEARDFFTLKECQALLEPRLTKSLFKLFHELTGLRVHVLWQTPLDLLHPDERSLACPTARQRRDARGDTPARCQRCQQRRWRAGAQTASGTRRCKGECGVTNFCAAVHAGTDCPSSETTWLEKADAPAPDSVVGAPTTTPGAKTGLCLELVLQARVVETKARLRVERPASPNVAVKDFHRAAALLEIISHDLQTTIHNEMDRAELERSRRKLKNAECEQARLRAALHGQIPECPTVQAPPAPGSHAQQTVRAMLDYLHEHYHHPLTLKNVAASLQMNPDYLAHLFCRAVGLKFHNYLQELRLAKAGELLRDPRQHVCDVASALGFASAHHFRHTFKARHGVAPSIWRNGR